MDIKNIGMQSYWDDAASSIRAAECGDKGPVDDFKDGIGRNWIGRTNVICRVAIATIQFARQRWSKITVTIIIKVVLKVCIYYFLALCIYYFLALLRTFYYSCAST